MRQFVYLKVWRPFGLCGNILGWLLKASSISTSMKKKYPNTFCNLLQIASHLAERSVSPAEKKIFYIPEVSQMIKYCKNNIGLRMLEAFIIPLRSNFCSTLLHVVIDILTSFKAMLQHSIPRWYHVDGFGLSVQLAWLRADGVQSGAVNSNNVRIHTLPLIGCPPSFQIAPCIPSEWKLTEYGLQSGSSLPETTAVWAEFVNSMRRLWSAQASGFLFIAIDFICLPGSPSKSVVYRAFFSEALSFLLRKSVCVKQRWKWFEAA